MSHSQLLRNQTRSFIRTALREDAAFRDVTSRAVLPPAARIHATIVAKASGILAGSSVAAWTFAAVDPSLRVVVKRRDGARVTRGQPVLTIAGRARSIFAAERTALNLLGHLSGIATLTQAYVRKVRATRAKILDTRKTLPGLRALEKYAVKAGGGQNHRMDLSDALLIKTNHLKALGQGAGGEGRGRHNTVIQDTIARAVRKNPRRTVEIEVTNLAEFKAALAAKPDAILLDNWSLDQIRAAVLLRGTTPHAPRPTPRLEASGGVTLDNVRLIAWTGVDAISIGRLTHSAPSLDLSLTIV